MKYLIFCVMLGAGPALADDYLVFHAPSKNILCAISTGEYAEVRCDMMQLTPSYTKPPADCEFDWGSSFAVGLESRKGYLACVSDAIANDMGVELGYGQSLRLGGFTCSSEKSGLSCTNPAGHGFTISKAKQRLY